MSTTWIVLAVLCVGTVGLKAVGPATLGARRPPERVLSVIALVAPAILTSLVVYETLSDSHSGLTIDARIVGLGVAGLAAIARLPMIAIVVLAAGATALARSLA
jgi:branched-subunit amino acid transport protein AzlD